MLYKFTLIFIIFLFGCSSSYTGVDDQFCESKGGVSHITFIPSKNIIIIHCMNGSRKPVNTYYNKGFNINTHKDIK